MDPFIIIFTVGMVGLSAIFSYSSADPPSFSSDGKLTIVTHGRLVKWLFGLTVVVLLLITIREWISRSEDPGVLYLLILFTTLAGPYFLCEAFRTKFEYDNDQFRVTTAFRKTRIYSWAEIVDINYSHWRSTYVLIMSDGTKIPASEYLSGIDALMDFARRWKSYNQKN